MAKSSNLPVYKTAQRLCAALHETTKKAPKELRATLVQRLLNESVDLVVDIDSANRTFAQIRKEEINTAQKRAARIDALLFVASDQRCISLGAFALCVSHIDEVKKQLHGWAAQTQNQLTSNQAPNVRPST